MWRPSPHRRVVSDGPAACEDEDITLVIKQWPDDLANEAGTAKYLFGFTVNTFVLGTLRVALRATRVLWLTGRHRKDLFLVRRDEVVSAENE